MPSVSNRFAASISLPPPWGACANAQRPPREGFLPGGLCASLLVAAERLTCVAASRSGGASGQDPPCHVVGLFAARPGAVAIEVDNREPLDTAHRSDRVDAGRLVETAIGDLDL